MDNNEKNNLSPDFSIDDILASLSTEKHVDEPTESPSKTWSMDEIDKLLGFDIEPKTKEIEPKTIEIEKKVKESESKFFSDSQETDIDTPVLKVFAEPEKEISDEQLLSKNFSEEKSEKAESYIDNFESEAKSEAPAAEFNFKEKDDKIFDFTTEKPADEEPESQESEKQIYDHINIHPTYNENIEHNISAKRVEKTNTDSGIETDKYRERFLNAPIQNIEKTADYDKMHFDEPKPTIETPGIIIKKSKFHNTADLEPLPTIVSAEYELKKSEDMEKTMIANGALPKKEPKEQEDEELAGQIKLSGFEDEPEAEKVNEENAEEELREKRLEKIKVFKLDANLKTFSLADFEDDIKDSIAQDEENIDEDEDEHEYEDEKAQKKKIEFNEKYIDDEYNVPSDKSRILEVLTKESYKSLFLTVAQGVLLVFSLIAAISANVSNGGLFNGSAANYLIFNIAVLAISGGLGYKIISRGISGIAKRSPNASSSSVIITLLCFIQCIVMMFFTDSVFTKIDIYVPAACFVFFMITLSKRFLFKRTLENFEFCTNGTSLYSTQKIDNDNDAFEIGRGLLMGEPDISYNARTIFPSNFLKNSFSDDPADVIHSKLVPGVLIGSVIISIITGLITKSFVEAFTALVAVCCIGLPAFSLIASNIPLLKSNKKLNETGSMITGYGAVNEYSSTNAVVIDSSDLFRGGGCNIYGIKTFHSMRIDEAILDAAALIIESKGPLSDIFDSVILGRRELLPPVESLAYEDRLGLSAWIHGRRILVGSRDLLIHHNVEAPEKDFESKYTHDGRKVVYLAVAGKIAAMFVVKYQADEYIAKYLRAIENEGITLLVRTTDFNITEEMISESFKVPLSGIKIISSVAGEIFNKYSSTSLLTAESQIIHNGTEISFLKSFVECLKLNRLIPLETTIQLIYSSVAVCLVALLSFLSSISMVGAAQIVAFQLVWMAISCIVPIFKKT